MRFTCGHSWRQGYLRLGYRNIGKGDAAVTT